MSREDEPDLDTVSAEAARWYTTAHEWRQRAVEAEAKVARVDALAARWRKWDIGPGGEFQPAMSLGVAAGYVESALRGDGEGA